jgi:glycopeptide antibiotics resistance protein
LFDVFANIGLFVPFGITYFLAVPLKSRHATILSGIAVSFLISGGAEFFQVFCHNRISSTTDVITNVFGAALGLGIANFLS